MTDDSIDITESVDIHPCDTPRGMNYYDLEVLTTYQQERLNQLKIDIVKDDEKYLAAHPEIRAIILMIYKKILRDRPRADLHLHIASIFTQPKIDLQKEINAYVKSREGHKYEGDSAVNLLRKEREEAEEIARRVASVRNFITKDIMATIFEKVTNILGKKLEDVDTDKYESVSATILAGSLFDIFSRVSKTSYTAKKQEAVGDLINKEIIENLDYYASRIAETYLGIPLRRFKLYQGPDRGSSESLIKYSEAAMFEEMEEEHELEAELESKEEEEIVEEAKDAEDLEAEREAAAQEAEQRELEKAEKLREEREAKAREMMSRRAKFLAAQQDDDPFGELAAPRGDAKKEDGEGEKAPEGLAADLAKFASQRKGRGGPDEESGPPGLPGLPGLPGFNPDLAKLAGSRARDDDDSHGKRRSKI